MKKNDEENVDTSRIVLNKLRTVLCETTAGCARYVLNFYVRFLSVLSFYVDFAGMCGRR